VINKCKKS